MRKPQALGRRRWWSAVNAPLLAAIAATLLAALAYAGDQKGWWSVPGLDRAELLTVDARFRFRGSRAPSSDALVIVGVDDATRERHPEVFQTRRGWAALIDAIGARHPRAIGLDLFFQAPEVALSPEVVTHVRTAAKAVRAEPPPHTPATDQALSALDEVIEETRGDELLAAAVKRAKVVYLGTLFYLPEHGEKPASDGAAVPPGVGKARYDESALVAAPPSRRPARAVWVGSSLPAIADGAAGAGAVNVITDDDGAVRRVPLALEYGGALYMPMGMALARAALGADASYVVGDDEVRLGDRRAPVDPQGEAMLSYLGKNETFPRLSAADVLDGRIPDGALTGKLVLVGFTDKARDKVQTPLDAKMDGVEIHATLAHNLIYDQLMRPTTPAITLLTMLALGALITLAQLRVLRRRRAWLGGVIVAAAVVGYLIAAQVAFHQGVVVAMAAPLGTCVLVALASLGTALGTEGREKRAIRAAFSQYLAESLVERIASNPSRWQQILRGTRDELTVLFSDIRGFSRFSETLDPELLSSFLHEYLTPMTDLVLSSGGLLDKYIGDAVMAIYGAPEEMNDHARRACDTALTMLERLAPLNAAWKPRGLPAIVIGIGINTGPMSVGNMGSDARFDYTVMGDAVNLGARLEPLTKEYEVDILVGEETARQAGGGFVFRELDLVRVKGRQGTARVFQLVGRVSNSPLSDADLARWNRALADYRAHEWDAAERGFAQLLDAHPEDGPAQVMRRRVRALRLDPPGDDWDGVYAQVSK